MCDFFQTVQLPQKQVSYLCITEICIDIVNIIKIQRFTVITI